MARRERIKRSGRRLRYRFSFSDFRRLRNVLARSFEDHKEQVMYMSLEESLNASNYSTMSDTKTT